MRPYAYHLFGADGSWVDDDIGPTLFEYPIGASTLEMAIAKAKAKLDEIRDSKPHDFAWLKDDDGWTVWASAEDR